MKSRLFFFVILFLTRLSSFAQDKVVVDSLELLIHDATTDTLRINYLLEISRYYLKYDLLKASKYAQQAKDLSTEKSLAKFIGKSDHVLGSVFFNKGDYRSASIHFFNCLRQYENLKDTMGVVTMFVNLGAVHDRLLEYDKALEYYLKAQSLANTITLGEIQHGRLLPSLYNNIANIYHTKKDYSSARQYYEKSLQIARESKNKPVEGIALNNLGKLYSRELHDNTQAMLYLSEALKVRKEVGDKSEIAKSYVQLSDYFQAQKNYAEAARAAEQVLVLGKEMGSLELLKDGYQGLFLSYRSTGNYQRALEMFQEYKRYSDSIQSQMASREMAKLQLQYDFEKAEQVQIQERNQIRMRFTIVIIALSSGLLIAILVVIVIRSRARQTELQRKNLAKDIEIKNKELTTNVMYLIRKNELINSVAERLLPIKANILPENQKAVQDIILDLQREADNDTWKEFELRFNQVHSEFYEKLRKAFPGLSPADEKLCAFLRLNMSSKEIAAITQQSFKSVEVARARLRKKLNLTNTTSNLVTYLSNL